MSRQVAAQPETEGALVPPRSEYPRHPHSATPPTCGRNTPLILYRRRSWPAWGPSLGTSTDEVSVCLGTATLYSTSLHTRAHGKAPKGQLTALTGQENKDSKSRAGAGCKRWAAG